MTPAARGRFAPTPSGPLHLGSLLTALASFLDARATGAEWHVRMDDLDAPRCPPGAAETILSQLRAHGLLWDGDVRFQADHLGAYVGALDRLHERCYSCACTRATLRSTSRAGPDGPVYAGTCRGISTGGAQAALRVRVGDGLLTLDDRWQGDQARDLARDIGDFVVRRADGQVGYQLACVVDEAAMGVSRVVRGADLLGSSLRQRWLQGVLDLSQPSQAHLPVLQDASGRKLSKQNGAPAVEPSEAPRNLLRCLQWLGQAPPPDLADRPIADLLHWAIGHWRDAAIPRARALSIG